MAVRTSNSMRSPIKQPVAVAGGSRVSTGGGAAPASGSGSVSGEGQEVYSDVLLQYWALRERVELQDKEIKVRTEPHAAC